MCFFVHGKVRYAVIHEIIVSGSNLSRCEHPVSSFIGVFFLDLWRRLQLLVFTATRNVFMFKNHRVFAFLCVADGLHHQCLVDVRSTCVHSVAGWF